MSPPRAPIGLAPQTIVGTPDVVPLVGGLEPARLGHVLLASCLVEGDSETGLVRDGDVALVDDGLVDTIHQVAPIRTSTAWFSSTRKFLGRGGFRARWPRPIGVCAQCSAIGTPYSWAISPIFLVSGSRRYSAGPVNDVHRMVPAEYLERLLQEDVLAGHDRDIHGVGDLFQQFRLLPGIMSSSHEMLYLVRALPSRMQLLTLKGPK